MKKNILWLILAASSFVLYGISPIDKAQDRQPAIAKKIIRLHVIANSNSEADQQLKMEVKEEIVTYLRDKMKNSNDKKSARQIIRQELPAIENLATDIMRKKGYPYTATAELGDCYFPIKEYGDMTFPAGTYEALRVKIGESRGRNWWCVMYPSLCLVDGVCHVPDESKEKLQSVLSKSDYDSLLGQQGEVTYASKLVEWIKGLW